MSPARDWPTKRDRAELILVALASLLVRGGERLTLLGSAVAPMTGRVALTRLVQLIEGQPIAGAPGQTSAAPGMPSFEPLPRAGQLVLIGDFLAPLDAINGVVTTFAGAGLRGHLLHIADPAEEDLPFDGRVRFAGVEERDEIVISRVETVRADYRRASGVIARGSPTLRGRSAGRSATTAPTGRRTWRCSRSMPRWRRTAGGEAVLRAGEGCGGGCLQTLYPLA